MNKLYDSETGCCPRFNPEPWDEKEHNFKNKLFIKDRTKSILHIPINFGSVMTANMKKIVRSDALAPSPFMLADENSLWGSDIYIEVAKNIPDSQMVTISGSFLTKVFEGPYKNIRGWIKQMQDFVASRGRKINKLYFFYTTCPKCAKFYGKNYVVLVAQVD
jgi:hypothetical protein